MISPNSQQDQYHSVSSRVDHQINPKNRLSLMGFSTSAISSFRLRLVEPAASPATCISAATTAAASIGPTLSATTVLDIKYGFIFHPFQVGSTVITTTSASSASSQQFIAQAPHLNYPGLNIGGGYSGTIGNAGTGTPTTSQYTTTFDHSLSGTVNKTLGKHSLKFGGELFIMKANNNTPASSINPFSFSAGFTQQNAQTASATSGNPFASLLLGWPSGGGVSYTIACAFQQIYEGVFVQDDWRITPKLTLNIGLRWEYESPMSERYNRQNAGFAVDATNPLQSRVTA